MRKHFLLICLFLASLACFSQETLREQAMQQARKAKQEKQFPTPAPQTQTVVYKLKGYTDSTRLYYSRTANCKMECIKVVEEDVRQVLKEGEASLAKPKDSSDTQKVFFVEGDTKTNKRIKIVVTPKGNALFVITVNPAYEKADCDCNKKES